MRPIDADKLKIDRMTDKGLAISQSQIANAETLEVIPTSKIEKAIAEIEQLTENDYPQMDRTITKFKNIVLDIIYKHTGIGDEYDKGRRKE